MQIAASIAVVRAAYAAPPVPRAEDAAAAALPAAAETRTPVDPWTRWPAAQEPVGLPADDWARYEPGAGALSRLTPGDRELLHAVTGTVIASDGSLHGPAAEPVDPLVMAVHADRSSGLLVGELTADGLADLVDRHGSAVDGGTDGGPDAGAIDPGHLLRAADFFAAREHRRAEDPHPRSSFTVDL